MGSVTPRIPLSLKASILENMDLVEVVVFEEEEEEGDGWGEQKRIMRSSVDALCSSSISRASEMREGMGRQFRRFIMYSGGMYARTRFCREVRVCIGGVEVYDSTLNSEGSSLILASHSVGPPAGPLSQSVSVTSCGLAFSIRRKSR